MLLIKDLLFYYKYWFLKIECCVLVFFNVNCHSELSSTYSTLLVE